jgi:uncharacterized repeat protein (TIGR03803 family)
MFRLGYSEWNRLFAGILALTAGLSTAIGLAQHTAAADHRLKVLHRFCPRGGLKGCPDGKFPAPGLIKDAADSLYGTTCCGGNGSNAGVVFELTPNASRTSWTETVLYSFCPQGGTCADGNFPEAGVIIDRPGNLYGTTALGGNASNAGVVFELRPNASRTAWTETVLYSFCPQGGTCADGRLPEAGVIMDAAGSLYGTTYDGGSANSGGVVFRLTPNASRTTWTEAVLYSFCPQGGRCADGKFPAAGLVMDKAGNLYGTTNEGGNANDNGVVFKLTPNASRTAWAETVLYSFCAQGGTCADGRFPFGNGLIIDGVGNLYGTTYGGGNASNAGVVFELTPNASRTAWTERVLYSFCPQGGTCADGSFPFGNRLIMDGAGNLYGTTSGGGNASNAGVAFELTPNASRTAWTETVLYSFCPQGGTCLQGGTPLGGVTMDGSGNLYGTTASGGINNRGVAFELVKFP